MRKGLPHDCGGFTLVELMITVVISGLLFSGALTAYRGLSARQVVKQAGISFQTDLKSYQQKALAGTKPIACVAGDTIAGYQVSYVDEDSYSVVAVCSLGLPAVAEVNLPQGVEFQVAFNPGDIFFPVLVANITGAQTIVLTKDTYSYQVIIEPSGVIRGQML